MSWVKVSGRLQPGASATRSGLTSFDDAPQLGGGAEHQRAAVLRVLCVVDHADQLEARLAADVELADQLGARVARPDDEQARRRREPPDDDGLPAGDEHAGSPPPRSATCRCRTTSDGSHTPSAVVATRPSSAPRTTATRGPSAYSVVLLEANEALTQVNQTPPPTERERDGVRGSDQPLRTAAMTSGSTIARARPTCSRMAR